MKSFRPHRENLSRMGKGVQRRARARRLDLDPLDLPPRPPAEGTRLKTVIVIDHLAGTVDQIDLHQGDRANRYHARIGDNWRRGICATRLAAIIRRKWALRWLVE